MNNVDYTSNTYHQKRHSEFLESKYLCKIWSEFCFYEYFDCKFPENILEFGAGLGINLFYISQKSNCFIVEPSNIGFINANKLGLKTFTSLSDLKKFTNIKFDVILCRHVLEHVDNPLECLLNLKCLLNQNGHLKLILPIEKIKSPVNNEIDYHLYCWTPRTICNLLVKAGYTNIKYEYNYFTGKRFLLPVYKLFGVVYYRFLMKLLGKLSNSKELYIQAGIN